MKTEGQYTLDADPMVLAKRVQTLEMACDVLSACLVELTRSARIIADQCDKALCEDKPLQAKALYEECEALNGIEDRAHAMSVMMNRSY